MSDYRDRVRKERADLDEKLIKLERFIATNMNADTLLKLQAAAMRDYVKILDARIAGFSDDPVIQASELIAAFKATQPAGKHVTATIKAPEWKRAIAWVTRDDGNVSKLTIPGGTTQCLDVYPGDVIKVTDGEPHSTVADDNSTR